MSKKEKLSLELRFARRLMNPSIKKRYYTTHADLYCWTGTHYAHAPFEKIEANAAKWLANIEADKATPNRATACAKYAMQMCDELPPQVTDKVIIPVQNGYIHFDTAKNSFVLNPHNPRYGMQYVLACEYDKKSTSNEWNSFLDKAVPDQAVQSFLQEFVGYTLMPDNRFQTGLWLTGNGANGKGVFAKVIEQLHNNTAAINLDSIGAYDLEGVVGSSLIIADEVGRHISNEQTVKKLVSGEPMQINRKYLKVVKSFRNTAKVIALSNHMPKGGDQSDGFWRRWFLVPFETKIPVSERIPNYDILITKDGGLAGILNWALDGLQRLLERGYFEPPLTILEQVEQAKIQADSVHGWIKDCGVERSENCDANKKVVYTQYKEWCHGNGLKAVGTPSFMSRLDELLGVLDEKRRVAKNGERPRCINVTIEDGVAPKNLMYPCGQTMVQNDDDDEAHHVPF